jgi:hypothetical protein
MIWNFGEEKVETIIGKHGLKQGASIKNAKQL